MRRLGLPAAAFAAAAAVAAGAGLPNPPSQEIAVRTITEVRPGVAPSMGCWFLHEDDFAPGAYKPFLDAVARHSPFDVLTTSIRADRELTDPPVRRQIADATAYARARGIGIAMDLDVRLARRAFNAAHPGELQEMLRLRRAELSPTAETTFEIASEDRADHYTGGSVSYRPMAGRLVRVYAFQAGAEGIEPTTVRDITGRCRVVRQQPERVTVALPPIPAGGRWSACVMAAFAHLTPDAYAPHIVPYQRQLLELYRDVPLAGACKDEWGFPPSFDACPAKDDYWFSEPTARAYRRRTGRDLARDCLLMTYGERGRQDERSRAVMALSTMHLRRHAFIEAEFYRDVKRVFGPGAYVCTHPTWWPNPDRRELMKNGLDWWMVRRDLAQTDETTPYCVRTALAKRWHSPTWHNMYYAPQVDSYRRQLWSNLLAGGRLNFHPVYPVSHPGPSEARFVLLRDAVMVGEARVRLLNLVTRAPLDAPAAVVFGHAAAANWAAEGYDDTGLALVAAIRRRGYAVDLIPSSEIGARSLRIDAEGRVAYGPQAYRVAVLYHPQFEGAATARFVQRARQGPTRVLSAGAWTQGPDARPFDGGAAALQGIGELPADSERAADQVAAALANAGVTPGLPSAARSDHAFGPEVDAPPTDGLCRLLDGTEVVVAGSHSAEGDPIDRTLELCGRRIDVNARGYVALRLDASGRLVGLAAGALSRFVGAGLDIRLGRPLDLALWRDRHGMLNGAVQGLAGPIPAPLLAVTPRWARLVRPDPMP